MTHVEINSLKIRDEPENYLLLALAKTMTSTITKCYYISISYLLVTY